MKKSKKQNNRQCRISHLAKKLCPFVLAAIASLFPGQEPILRADLDTTTDPLNWVLNSDGENPWKSTIGSGPNTPSNQLYTLTINGDAVAFPMGNNSAISLKDDWTVYVNGLVQNQANGNGGLWSAGPNTIESHSNTTIYVGSDTNRTAQVLATGNQANGEAINLIGNYNQIVNYGLIQSRTGAAIWFQDTITTPTNSNRVDNYGTIKTLKGSNASAIGNSGGNGVVFINREYALVDGGLSFAGGDDQLTFEPNSTVTGQINGGGGTNSLVLQGKVGSSDSIAGAVQNFTTLTKTGQGEWTVTGSLSGFTRVDVERGILRLTGDNTGYNGSVVINSSGFFDNDAVLEAKARSLPTTTSNVGNITNDGILRFIDGRIDDDGGIGSYAGQITGQGKVEVAGDGVVMLTNTDNTYSGGTHVKNGTLNVISDATLGAADGGIVLGDGTIGQPSTVGTLQFGSEFDLGSARSIRIEGAGGTIDTNGFDTTISQGITGGTFTKAGAGTLTMTGENTYAGGTYITGGTLQVGDGGTAGSIPYVGILSITGADAALAINRSDAVTIPTRITGAGKFIQRGSGTTTLTGTNTYAGGTDIENGTLLVQSNLNLGTGGMTFGTDTTGGTLKMNGNVDLNGRAITLNTGGGTIDTNGFRGSASGVISGDGGLTKDGDGVLTLTGNSTYTGGTTIAGGAIQLGDGGTSGSIVGDVANDGTLIFNRSDDTNSLALAGAISGTGNLIQRGSGTTTLSGGNSYSGGTVIENGTLAVNSDAALGAATGSLTFGTATTDGTLKLTADTDDLADRRTVTINAGGGTIDTGGYHGTTGANIQGIGHFTKTGTGILTLTADNGYTGGTTVTGGELELGDNTQGGAGSVTGDVVVDGTGTIVYNRYDDNTNPAGTVSGTGNVIQRGSGTTTITNSNTYTGSTTLENGTLAISEDANLGRGGPVIFDGGTLQLNADLTDFNPNRTVTLKSSGTIDTLGNTGTIGAVIDGSGTLTKDGSGTLILTGTNTYTGNTTIAEGTLKIGDGENSGSILGNVANSGTLIFNRDGTVTYPGVISGTGTVIQQGGASGTGTTIFTGDSTYTGGTTITSGTLQLGAGGTSGNITGNVDNSGTLAFDRSGSFVFSGVVSGDGNLVQKGGISGTGTTILIGTNTYTGGTLISSGALQLGNCGTSGSITGDVVDNGSLIFSRSDAQTFGGVISGSGDVVKQCTNILTVTGTNSYAGGTTLKQGGIVIANQSALGSTADNGDLAGHVLYAATNATDTLTVQVDSSIDYLRNHFHVSTGNKNVFQVDADLALSDITNNSVQQNLGGAFYVAGGAALDLNVGRTGLENIDLTFENNRYGTTENDFYLESHGTLNLNVVGAGGNSTGNAVFVNSGIGGQGSIFVNGPGLVQISADSQADETIVNGSAMRLVDGMRFSNTTYDQDTQSSLQGNGIIDVSGSPLGSITISGTIRPDSATFASGDGIVDRAERFGTLTLTGGTTVLNSFTFDYDVAGPTADHTNDLVKFGSQDVKISGGTVNFVTLGTAGLVTGRYLVFDSDAATYMDGNGTALTDLTIDTVLKGKINGVDMTSGTPRLGYDFQLENGTATNSQIWLDVARNTLQVVWQGGDGNWTPGNWESVQQKNGTHANDFNDGDLAIFSNSKGDADVTLDGNIVVSGLQLAKDSTEIINVKIDGGYGISARMTDASIEGEYAKTDGSAAPNTQEFNTTGKLEIFGVYNNNNDTMTTLTLANTGVNEFREGIDIYGGRIVLEGPNGRLGTFSALTGNAGLVTFKVPSDPEVQKHVVEVNLAQTLQNRFVVESTVNNAFIIANANTTISGITDTDGAIELQDDASLTLEARGTGNIILSGNGTTDVKMGEYALLNVAGTGNTFVKSGIQGAANSWLGKDGSGTLQIEADSHVDTTWINDGTFRVVNGIVHGQENSSTSSIYVAAPLQGDATIAGAGTIRANNVEVRGRISPDNLDAVNPTGGSRYGTLTLVATGTSPTLELTGFTMNFDITVPTTWTGTVMPTNDQDLLVLNGTTVAIAGTNTIDFRSAPGGSFGLGDYLVIKSSNGYVDSSDDPIDSGSINAYLTPMVDGYSVSASSPRGTLHFETRNSADGAAGGDNQDIWIVNQLNSLSMNWTGTNANVAVPISDTWERGVDRMKSAQFGGVNEREAQFMNGDKVFIYNPGTSPISVTLTRALQDDAVDVTVSGLVVGKNSGSALNGDDTSGTVYNGDVTIDGLGSITANAGSAFGNYLIQDVDHVRLKPTGSLQKFGSGGLIVRNTGGNRFLGGTEIYDGTVIIGHHQALGAVDGTGTNLDGYVSFLGSDNVTRAVSVFPTDGTAPITNISNHFRAESTAGTNVFVVDNVLTISGVENNSTTAQYGGAFYIGSNLTIDADGDLTLSGNSYNVGSGSVANDIYLMTGSTLNVNIADATGVFVNSGIDGSGLIFLNGSGTNKNGFLQIAANSSTNETRIQSGRLRLIDNVYLNNSTSFTLAAGASFEGKGYLFAFDGSWIHGIVSPDAAKFTSGTDTVDNTEKIGVLHFQGGNTHFDGFTFQYDVVAANTTKDPGGSPNDLIQLASQPAYIHGGTVDFRTADADMPLGLGNYLVIDSNASTFKDGGGINLDNTMLNTVLSGQINGEAFETFGPRTSHDFYFDTNNANANSQIWLGVSLNSLSMEWTGASGSVWNFDDELFESYQVSGDGLVREKKYMDGDKVYLSTDTDLEVIVNQNVLVRAASGPVVSGLVVGQDTSDTPYDGNVTISGTGGITADASSAFGKYVNATTTPLDPTGKLEKFGTGTLTFTNTGGNTFEEGIEIQAGIVGFNRADQLAVNAGKVIEFTGSSTDAATLRADKTTYLDTALFVVGLKEGWLHAGLDANGQEIAMLVRQSVSSEADNGTTLHKTGAGIVQLSNVDSTAFAGMATVEEGTFRVVPEITFGNAISAIFDLIPATNTDATLAGGGTINANFFTIGNGSHANSRAIISPDKATLTDTDITISATDKFGTLTLKGNGSGNVIFSSVRNPGYPAKNIRDGFWFDYDVNAPNTVGSTSTTNDLLVLDGMSNVYFQGGVVNFRTGTNGLRSGSYLVIDSNVTITDSAGDAFVDDPNAGTVLDGINDYTNRGGVLWGKINDQDIRVGSPRRELGFELRDGQAADSQIWLDVQNNTLQVVWQGGADNVWTTANSWESVQFNNVNGTDYYDNEFYNGDYVIFNDSADADGYDVTLNETVTVSGMDADTGQTIILGGTGGINAISQNSADYAQYVEGIYADGLPLQNQRFDTTGMLKKTGIGTWTFANTGTNTFDDGIEIEEGILSYNNADQLLVGTGKAITFTGTIADNATLRADATTELETDILVDDNVTGTLHADYQIGMLMNKTISGGTAATLDKTGEGLVQLSVDSKNFNGVANVNDGTLRILDGKTFGSDGKVAGSTLNVSRNGGNFGTLAGAGTFKAETIVVNGNISPDNLVDHVNGTQTGSQFGTLTLEGNVNLDGFVLDYDVNGSNGSADPSDTTNDLLQISGAATLTDGLIALRDSTRTVLENGEYLIVNADRTIVVADGKALDGIENTDGALAASYNGSILSNETPRHEFEFEFRDYNGVTDSQIWLVNEVNTLYMNWTAGEADWNADAWTSEQTTLSGGRAEIFLNGDFVSFADRTGDSTANLAGNVLVGGLDSNTDKNVTISGAGGITAKKSDSSMIGRFVKTDGSADPDAQEFNTTGLFRKYGTGTTTFANTGTNLFSEGIELYGGTLSYNNADQLTVNDGKAMTFVENATLRADATAELDSAVVVNSGKSGTLHVDDGNAMLLQKSVSGGGNLTKTGEGIVQLGVTSTIGGNVDVQAGTFRVIKNAEFTVANVRVDTAASLQGGGTVSAETITVYGHISPDAATLTTANIVVSDADKFGTLTLDGNVTLDGFTFDYDLGTAYTGTAPSSDPTGDLLKIVGSVDLAAGHVAFRGGLETGKYLIVDSDSAIELGNNELDGINDIDGVLTASLNGNVLTNETPRNELEFRFENDKKQIWLETEINTLYMSWTGGTGNWNIADTNWESSQTTLSGGREHVFRNGDFVVFTDQTQDSHVTLNSPVVVGGLDSNTGKNVTFTGSGGILARKSDGSMIGQFVKTDGSADPSKQEFNTTGLFRKYGLGTTTFTNTGGNLFDEGIELYQGVTEFNRADQLAVGDGKQLAFKGNSILRPTASLDYDVNIAVDDQVTGTFDTAGGVVFDYRGSITGSDGSTLAKTSGGTMNLRTDSTGYQGAIDIAAGTLGVYADYGNSKSFVVRDGATLTGTGTIGGTQSGVIENGGNLSPRGYTSGDPNVTHLTVDGNLSFEAGSNFDVTISQNPNDIDADGKMAPVSDYVKVQNGTVAIDSGANMNVEIDYWNGALTIEDFNAEKSSKFTVIDATDGTVENAADHFDVNLSEHLPRGVKIAQGWQYYANGWSTFDDGWLFQLWFEKDSDNDFEHLCDRHNRVEIGKNLDQLVLEADPALKDLILHLSSSCFSDEEVCELLDQITGDLRANSLMMAMKTPWRSPFNRLDGFNRTRCNDPCSAAGKSSSRYQLWGEWSARHDDVRSDRNAHPFTINRMGVTVGADKRLSYRTTLGLAFNYSDPRLRQATGKVEMDDYEIGLYGRTRLNNDWMLKYYAGYSHQRYDLTRNVYIPACEQDGFGALSESFRNKTDGDALAASIELIRNIDVRPHFRLMPVIAFDFNQAWQKGYRESGGISALEYKKTTLERMMLRFGLGSEYAVRNNIDLKARIQYATQLNSNEQARSQTQFANATISDQRYADIWGVRIGRDYLNLGVGMDWKPTRLRAVTLFVNYDADIYKRATIHAGEFGFVRQW